MSLSKRPRKKAPSMSLPTTSNSGLRTAALAQGRQNRTIRLTGIRSWFEAYHAAPLYSLALVFYMGLRTTAIFPESEGTVLPFWHPGYFGWYDIVFFCLMIGGAALSRLQVPRRALVVSVLFLVSIV